jgi:protein-L-isoaspartate O-methyltransferase
MTPEPEEIIFTRHGDGSITADHFPKYTHITAELLDQTLPGASIAALNICGHFYRVIGQHPRYFTYVLERVDDAEGSTLAPDEGSRC